MNIVKRSAASVLGLATLLVLLVVGVASNDLIASIAAVGLAIGLTALVGLGPERMGIGLMLIGMVMAPMNALAVAGNVTVSDVFFVLGFGLLIPRMLTRGRPKLPPLYVIGATLLLIGGIVSSLLAPDVAGSLAGFVKVIAATMVLVFVMNVLHPTAKLVDWLAACYVGGQIISTGYSLVKGSALMAQGRAIGLTTQPNFYGLGGQMAYALLIYLFYRVDRKHRWIVIGAMGIVGFSVLNSGSRASLLCCALITVLWPIVERSALAWYVIVSGAAIMVISANAVLGAIGQATVLDRLKGDTSAQYSDAARSDLLHQGLTLFWKHPIRGNGWTKDIVLTFHNAYLEVVVAGGVLTLVAFVLVIAALVAPLFRAGAPNRLAYAGLSYAAFGMIGPTLYDRIVWAVLCLILVTYDQHPDEEPEPEPVPAGAAHRGPRARRGLDLRGDALPTSLDGEPVSRD